MGTGGRMLALIGGGFIGICLGGILGGCLAYFALSDPVPTGTHKQHQSDWLGALIDTGDRAEVHGRNFARTVDGAAAGGAFGLLGGLLIAARAVRKVRRDDEPPAQRYPLISEAEPGAAPDRRSEVENRRPTDGPLLPPADGESRLTQELELYPRPEEPVTPSPTNAADRGRCPACGAAITPDDETCPSCEIAFVTDGRPKRKLGNVGPADGIYRPPTDTSE